MSNIIQPRGDDGDEIEERPFVPDPDRVIYPVDYQTAQRAARAKFDATTRVEVGGQITRRLIRHACDLEDQVRARARNEAHYTFLSMAVTSFLGDAIEVRRRYMNPDR